MSFERLVEFGVVILIALAVLVLVALCTAGAIILIDGLVY